MRTASSSNKFRTCTKLEKREMISRARAHELSVRYELGEQYHSTGLIKTAIFPTSNEIKRGAPSIVSTLTVKQANEQFARIESSRNQSKAQTDPLLSERERARQQRKENVNERIAQMNAMLSPAAQLSSRAPFGLIQPLPQQQHQQLSASMIDTHINRKNSGIRASNAAGLSKPGAKKFSFDATSQSSANPNKYVNNLPATPEARSIAATVIETPSPIVYRASNGKRYEVPNLC